MPAEGGRWRSLPVPHLSPFRSRTDLPHQLVERLVVAVGEGPKGVGASKDSLLDRLWNPLCEIRAAVDIFLSMG